MHRPLAAATLVAAVLAPAAMAQAATKTVDFGLAKQPAGAPETAAFYDFFPRKVKIRAGDKVKYAVNTFGIVYSGPKGEIEDLIQLDGSRPVAGAVDPAGNPFWFNGRGTPHANPALLRPAGDGKVEKGQKDVDHDSLPLGPSEPYVLSFAKPGTYKVYDALHPGVVNTVKVVKKGAKVPGKGADKARATKQAAKLVKEARDLASVTAPGNTILVGNDSKRVGFHQFFPPEATAKVNEPVTLDAGDNVTDWHNIAIGPESFMKANSAEGQLFQPTDTGFDLAPTVVYPSQDPSTAARFGGTENGGYYNSGTLDTDPDTALPDKTTVTFTAPGTYKYICLWHSDGVNGMSGTITVK